MKQIKAGSRNSAVQALNDEAYLIDEILKRNKTITDCREVCLVVAAEDIDDRRVVCA